MKVWRIEDENGVGMHQKLVAEPKETDLFTPDAFTMATMLHDWAPYDDDCRAQTDPNDDVKLMEALGDRPFEDFIFGFTSPKQMREWIYKDSWVRKLNEFGMHVAVYFVEEGTVVGDTQVLIPKGHEPFEKYTIGDYFGVH